MHEMQSLSYNSDKVYFSQDKHSIHVKIKKMSAINMHCHIIAHIWVNLAAHFAFYRSRVSGWVGGNNQT